jgi:putative component of toxin-antitoxin plasmid stabilization module
LIRIDGTRLGEELVLLLCGGDKNSQASDIAFAKKLASELED